MNKEIVAAAMDEISDRYVAEAADYEKKQRKSIWLKRGAAAACLAAASVAAFAVLPGFGDSRRGVSSGRPKEIAADVSDKDQDILPPATEKVPAGHVSMDNIYFNDLSGQADAAKLFWEWDWNVYDEVAWNEEDIRTYYGRELTPAYIPDGLKAAPWNGTATAIIKKDGTVEVDGVSLYFYHDYYEDGSPKLTEGIAAVKGFKLRASKIEILDDCVYILPENEVKKSDFGGVGVTFGYRSMPYGPYDPQSHEPSGYYDLYTAEFKCEDIEYKIVAEQMEAEELVKIVSSIIYGKEDVTLD